MPNIIGIDPSLTATGICHVDGRGFTSSRGKGDARLSTLYADVITAAGRADLAIIEDLPTNAMGAGKTGMAQGVVRLALQRMNVPYVTISAATLKLFATGSGRADKVAMANALIEHEGLQGDVLVDTRGRQFVEGLGLELTDDNQVDAWWLRQAGLERLIAPEPHPALVKLNRKKKRNGEVFDRPVVDWSPAEGWFL